MELFSTHKNRIEIEKDASMLANRISMLQFEEDKILKKIQQTRKRAEEIMLAKQRNDDMFDKRMRDKEMKMQQEEENRQKYFNDRAHRSIIKKENKKAILNANNKDFKIGKSLTIEHDNYKRGFQENVRKSNHLKKEKIRSEEEIRSEKLRQIEEEKIRENQEFYNDRVEMERQRILEEEKRIKVTKLSNLFSKWRSLRKSY
jgi:hypothetical protein